MTEYGVMRYDATTGNAVEATGLVKRFGKTTALNGVDLVARQGRVLGVLGPNGAGKPVTGLRLSLLLGCGRWAGRRLGQASVAACRSPEAARHACPRRSCRHRSPPVRRPAAAVRYDL